MNFKTEVCRLVVSHSSSAAYCCFICLFGLLTSYASPCQSAASLFSSFFFFPLPQFYQVDFLRLSPPLLSALPPPLSPVLLIRCLSDSAVNFFPFSIPLALSSPPLSSSSLSPRVTLDPSKRQSSNKSVSGCTLPQGTKTVSKSSFPMFSGCFCLSA